MTLLGSRRPDRAGRQALSRYRDGTRAARLHTMVRWWSAPFPAIEDALPPTGRILEIGCGHGLFSTYAALAQPGRVVHGVDIDPDKIRDAQASVRGGDARLSFALAPSGAVPEGPWDGVVIVDVLYLLSEADQRALLEEALATLAPGGVLVVKEMALQPAWKARWNTTQETLAVKLLGITEGHDFTFVPPSRIAEWLTAKGATVRDRRVDRGRLHPHHLIVAQVP
jgi:2-polyprenyl-3-methyl-5-hydroxy-6-metoxy-1,4-benzoquinol methylase